MSQNGLKRRCKVRGETPQVLAVSARLLLEVSQEMKRRNHLACAASLFMRVKVALQVRHRHRWRPALVVPCFAHVPPQTGHRG